MTEETIKEIVQVHGDHGGFDVVTSEQRIELRIDNQSGCCERWGYFWTNDETKEFIGARVLGVTLADAALSTKRLDEAEPGGLDCGGTMFVNIETDRGVLQFTAYNSHNGYYGHEASVRSKQLNHEETL